MATQQRQHGLISDEYGFLVGSRRLEQGIESVDDKVQRIIEFLEKNAKPVRVVNSQTVAQNQVAKDVSKLVTLTEKSHKEIQKTKVANSQTLRNGGNIKNRQADENSNLSTRPTRTVNSQTGATNSSASVGSLAAELSTDQPTRTVNSQTSQQAQDRQRDANGRFVGGDGEQSKSSGGLFKGMTQAVRNGFLQANIDGQNLDPSIDALYEVKNILSPVGRVAGLMLRPLGALFKSKKRNEPLSREEEKHNKKEIKLLERIARMGGGGGGLLGGLLGRGGGLLRMVALPILALAGAFFGGFKIGQIINEKVGGWINTLIEADIPKKISEAWNGFITKLSELIPDVLKKAFEATPFGAAQKAGSAVWDWIKEKVTGTNVPKYLLQKQHGGYGVDAAPASDSPQSAGGAANSNSQSSIKKIITPNANRSNTVELGDGSIVKRTGNRNWRNNNPGNIEYGELAKKYGAIGSDGRFAIFPDYASGRKAKEHLIFESNRAKNLSTSLDYGKGLGYKDKTLKQTIAAYAPIEDNNDTNKYQKEVLAAVNGQNKKMSDYSPAERKKIMDAMEKVEGYKAGETKVIKSAVQPVQPSNLAKTTTPVVTLQKTGTPKATALPPTISKPPVVPSLSMKPTINMKAQPIQFRSAAKVEAIPKIETVPEMHTSPKPMLVQSVNSGDNISQNLSDRGLAHLVTGGLGENRYGA